MPDWSASTVGQVVWFAANCVRAVKTDFNLRACLRAVVRLTISPSHFQQRDEPNEINTLHVPTRVFAVTTLENRGSEKPEERRLFFILNVTQTQRRGHRYLRPRSENQNGGRVNCFIHENVSYIREQRIVRIVTSRLESTLIASACYVVVHEATSVCDYLIEIQTLCANFALVRFSDDRGTSAVTLAHFTLYTWRRCIAVVEDCRLMEPRVRLSIRLIQGFNPILVTFPRKDTYTAFK